MPAETPCLEAGVKITASLSYVVTCRSASQRERAREFFMPCVTYLARSQAKAETLMAPSEVALPWSRGPPHKGGAWPPPQSAPRAENATQCSDCLSHGFSTEVLVENIRMPVVGIGIPGRACGHFDVYFSTTPSYSRCKCRQQHITKRCFQTASHSRKT